MPLSDGDILQYSASQRRMVAATSVASKLASIPLPAYIGTASKTVSATTTETSCIPNGLGTLTVPSAVFDAVGYRFEFDASGKYSGNGVALLTIKIKLGTHITLQISSLGLPNVTDRIWSAEGRGTVRSGRVLFSHAMLNYDDGTTKLDSVAFARSEVTIGAGDKTADMTVQWALTLGSSSFTVEQMVLKIVPFTS